MQGKGSTSRKRLFRFKTITYPGPEAIAPFEGLLQNDGYACSSEAIVQLGCWVHARRRFYEAYRDGELDAARYLLPIRGLYALESEADGKPVERLELRRRRRLPIVERIEAMLEYDVDRFLAKTGTAEAVRYVSVRDLSQKVAISSGSCVFVTWLLVKRHLNVN